ncbi:MAG: HD domain-containing protein [Lachnospiraceae bacterium]|nr:HD domain-containing protein [Lachnospiraceae bacterium]
MSQKADLERLKQQFSFITEIDKEKEITRQTYLSDGQRKENDAEHAWHLALMTILLNEYANDTIDVLRTVTMVLLHDIVEIDAGDTYAYDEEGKKTQRARETKAADRIFGLLPKDQGEKMRGLWEEFEAWETAEAKFAHVMDNLQPVVLTSAADGKSWKEHGVHQSQIMKRNERTHEGSETLWNYVYENMMKPFMDRGVIRPDNEEN